EDVKPGAIPLRRDEDTAASAAAAKVEGEASAPGGDAPSDSLPLRGGRMNRKPPVVAGDARSGDFSATPQALVAAGTQAAHDSKIDRSRYEIVRDVGRLKQWAARARELGLVAIDTETTTLNPMQATLCGFSLAIAPNE